MKPINDRFDVSGQETARLFRFYLLWKPLKFGSLGDEPGFGNLFELMTRHYLGRTLSYLTTRFEREWLWLLQTWRRTLNRVRHGFRTEKSE